ncbi:hypothetical protein DFH09DRAFT_1121361 [Mycena vulgaris]|nr:hypothetical protein DFH09DRAFT_1121361 [Mycena vulgaris]
MESLISISSPNVDESQVIWASRALISAAALYFYDFLLTFANEVELYRHSGRNRKLLWSFIPLRYLPALYQLLMVFSLIYISPTLTVSRTPVS